MSASLTPNEDAARDAIASMPGREGAVVAGQTGVSVRMLLGISEARVIAMAREFDRATPQEEIVEAFVTAIAAEIGSVASSFSDRPREFGALLIRQISLRAGIAAREISRGGITSTSMPITKVSRG